MGFRIRVMTAADVAAGMRLKDLAGWNQTQQDWLRFLQSSPEGCFVAEWNGQVAGTVTTIVYENRFAWIGMVLVDPDLRGKGIGTALLKRAIDYLDARGIPCLKLDATPQGRPIYERLGFQVEYEIERRLLERKPGAPGKDARLADPKCLDSVLEMDREIFGADRDTLLRSLAGESPEFVVVARNQDLITGYALGRRGSRADHMGPWVATSAAAAQEILTEFLRRSRRESAFVDVLKGNPWAVEFADREAFRFSRVLTRMYRGENSHPGRVDRVCAIVGPEFG